MFRSCLLLMLLLPSSHAPAGDAAGATLSDGWVRAAPPGAKVLAGYGRIVNPGARPLVIVSALSPDFGSVELHEMRMEGDVMHMRRLERLEVAAGASLALEPGGTHLMLIGPKRPPKVGDRIDLQLRTAEDAPIDSRLVVRQHP